MKVKKWCVQTIDYYAEESYRNTLEGCVKHFDTEAEAIAELERAIREDWTSEVGVDDEVVSLADLRGRSACDSVKYSEWNYSEDGKTAWVFYSTGSGHKGEVFEVEIEVKGQS